MAIEGTWAGNNRGSIAIDDIILINGTCRTSTDQCDFDTDDSICGKIGHGLPAVTLAYVRVSQVFNTIRPDNSAGFAVSPRSFKPASIPTTTTPRKPARATTC